MVPYWGGYIRGEEGGGRTTIGAPVRARGGGENAPASPPRLVGANILITSISLAPALCRALYEVLGPRGNTRDTAPGHMEPKRGDWSTNNQGGALRGQ